MFNKPFLDISLQDIKDLVLIRKERENNNLEYKREIDNSDTGKKGFLKDVTGMANGSGGFLIIGVKEEDGHPAEIVGTQKEVGNQKIEEWIENIILANTDERVRYEIKVFDILKNDKVLIVLYIAESSKKPHMVTFNEKNTYFMRHNTSVNPATQAEVRDMFEYSRKNINLLEDFLSHRSLLDDDDFGFGLHDNSLTLFNDLRKNDESSKPFVLYSFVPRFLDNDRVNTASEDFLSWLEQNSKVIPPFEYIELFKTYEKQVNLHGITFPTIIPDREDGDRIWYENYFEFLNNGFFEAGISSEIFWNYGGDSVRRLVMNLTKTVGYAWLLLNFAGLFYKKIDYYDEVTFQISVVNIRNFALGGFGAKNKKTRYAEPFSTHYDRPPFCKSHDRFKIIQRFLVNELSEAGVKDMTYDIAEKISRAFGETNVKCFDDDKNFNTPDMRRFRS